MQTAALHVLGNAFEPLKALAGHRGRVFGAGRRGEEGAGQRDSEAAAVVVG